MKTVTINTVQGIGDIFWVYQKLAPYFDVINLNVLCVEMSVIQLRAKAFCRMLPKIGEVTHVLASPLKYKTVAKGRFALASVLNARTTVDYAVNAPMELGINLRDIDPGTSIEEFVDLGLPNQVDKGNYLCVFVAGAKHALCWPTAKWLYAIRQLAKRLDVKDIVLVGAGWDTSVQDVICTDLSKTYSVTNHVGNMELGDSINVIRQSRFFFGFQSGLNVIADNYDVSQLMLYYRTLVPMLYTWCRPANVRTKFNAATFDDNFDQVLAGIAT